MAVDGIHDMATAFSGAAAVYEQTRPGYPPEVRAWLGDHVGIGRSRRVLDLAAGTGKLTRELLATGANVIAVEPIEGMRRTLAAALPGTAVIAGVARALPLGSGTVDALTVAQAMHWFATPEAFTEMHRVMRRGSRLAVVWNRRDLSDPLQAGLHRIMAPVRGDTPSGTSGEWRRVLEHTEPGVSLFSPDAELRAPWAQAIDVEGVVGRVASVSFVAALPDAARHRLLDEVRAEARRFPEPLVLPYVAEAYCYRRLD